MNLRTVARMIAVCLLAGAWPGPTRRPSRPGSPSGTSRPRSAWRRPGGYGKAYHKSIHDPCKVRAVGLRRRPSRGSRSSASTPWASAATRS